MASKFFTIRRVERGDRLRVFQDSGTLRDGMTRRLVALVVAGVVACGPILTYADPPDPTWVAGSWSDANLDDAIARVISTAGVVETHALGALEPHWMWICSGPPADDSLVPSPVFAPHVPRGPPLA